jgi:hypothetical protein
VNYTVGANTSTSSRTGTLTIAGQTFTITQAGVSGASVQLTAAPPTLAFTCQIGGAAPPSQTVSLTATGGGAVSFTFSAATSTGGDWLSAGATSTSTPATLSISVTPAVLSTLAGDYWGALVITAPGATNSPLVVKITLTVSQSLPKVTAVLNAASYAPGSVAPGEMVYIGGANMGPQTLTTLQLNAQGLVDTTLAETRVLFDGFPAPLIYVWHDRLSCIVPYAVAGRVTTRMQVEYKGQLSTPIEFSLTDAAPGLFTLNQQGTG